MTTGNTIHIVYDSLDTPTEKKVLEQAEQFVEYFNRETEYEYGLGQYTEEYIESADPNLLVVLSSLDILEHVTTRDYSNNRPGIAFLPTGNLISDAERQQWQDVVIHANTGINIIAGSYRSVKGFPHFNKRDINVYTAPIFGITPTVHEQAVTTRTPEPETDIFYHGRIEPDTNVHTLIEIAGKVSELLGRKITVGIAGDSRNETKAYWDEYCVPNILPGITGEIYGDAGQVEVYEAMQKARTTVYPCMSPNATWSRNAWEAASLGCHVFGADWAGITEAAQHQNRDPWPVERHKPIPDIPRAHHTYIDALLYTSDIENFTGYRISTDRAAEDLTAFLSDNPKHKLRDASLPPQANAETLHQTFIDILNNSNAADHTNRVFPHYVDYLAGNLTTPEP